MIENIPAVIYLQIGSVEPEDESFDFEDYEGNEAVTWCSNSQFESDIKYLHADKVNPLLEALQEYIRLLNTELTELVGTAAIHGWRSHRVEQGKELRNKIEELQKNIK